jgi:hypothetical protein
MLDEFKVANSNAAALALKRRQQEREDFKMSMF